MYSWAQGREKEADTDCGVSLSDLRYPHEAVYFGSRATDGCVKREPISANALGYEGFSKVVVGEGSDPCALRNEEMRMLADMESGDLTACNDDQMLHRGACHYSQCPPQGEYLHGSVNVKEEVLSDDEVVDVYPLGLEISRHGSGAHVLGESSNHKMLNAAKQNAIITKTRGSRVLDVQCLDVAVVSCSDKFSQNQENYAMRQQTAITARYAKDEEERGAYIADFGCQVGKKNRVDELQDDDDAEFVYLDESSKFKHGSSGSCGLALTERRRKGVSCSGDAVDSSHSRNGACSLSLDIEAQHMNDLVYYDEESNDDENEESMSFYEPSSNESESDGNSPEPAERTVRKKCKSGADRTLGRMSDRWKVDEIRCPACSCVFAAKDDLDCHVCTISNISCNVCGKRVKGFDALQRHEKVHLEVKPYSCDICGKGFREKGNLTTHKRTHTKETPYKCEHCNKRFADPSNFNRHRKSHLGLAIAKPCQCKFCGERFSRTANLLRHLVRFHKGEKDALNDDLEIGTEAEIPSLFKKLACSFCSKTFGKKEILQTHELLHKECQALTCKHCRRLLSSRDGLIQHLKIHGVQVDGKSRKEYICSFCGTSFLSKLSLTGHERTHTKEWMHTCTICGAHFTLKTSLNRHLLTHSGMKPHACDVCKKRFLRAYDLTVHKRTHSKERPYTCHACGRGFAAQTNFSKHSKKCGTKSSIM